MNIDDLITHMQAAVDAVQTSPHPTNKIAATLAGIDKKGGPFSVTQTNHWPRAIEQTIGTQTPVGNSSGTLHAETACILAALNRHNPTKKASLFITDPPCPNCMKNLAEAGITALYIDHKGFNKDWSKRRGDSFDTMSMRIAAKAGIDVHVLYRKERRFEIISQHAPGYKPSIENPAHIEATNTPFKDLITIARLAHEQEPFALALAHGLDGDTLISVNSHPTVGYTYETVEQKNDKYSFILHPLNRLLMIAAHEGLALDPAHIYTSTCPTARELVNFIGAELNSLHIGAPEICRDKFGLLALEQLREAGILKTRNS